jgi:hypothetical protein
MNVRLEQPVPACLPAADVHALSPIAPAMARPAAILVALQQFSA